MSRSAPRQPAAATLAGESSTHGGALLRKCACGNTSHSGGQCDRCKEKNEEQSLHRKAVGAARDHEAPPIVHDVLSDHGRPLDAGTRSDMEQRFGHDFARVRVHTGTRAAESARAVSALAYTVGQHVVFGANQFAPTTTDGRHLLAHELAHTVQQRATGERRQNRLIVRDHDSADERAADRAADIAVRGGSTSAMPALASTATGSVQRKGGQLSPKEVDAVYLAWIAEIQRSRGIKGWNTAQDQEVRERLKKQVGPGNYANFVRWEESENEKHWAKAKDEEAKKKAADERARNYDPVAEQNATVAEMWAATETLRKEVVRVERLAQKLNFGGGFKGTVARGTAAAYAGTYGIAGRTATSVSEHAPMLILGAAGTAVGFESGEKLLVSEGRAIKQEGEEMGDDARTAVRLAGGDLQANYEATRPSYDKYWAAQTTFNNHRSDFFNKYRNLSGMTLFVERAPHIGGMSAAMKEMKEAGNDFLMKCAQLGIETDAGALNKMGDNIMKGAEGVLETAVTGVVPELAPGLAELKSAVKGAKRLEKPIENEVKEQVAKQVVKAADDAPVASAAKKADDVAAAGARKTDDAVAAGAKRADEAPAATGAGKANDAPAPSGTTADAPTPQQTSAAPKSPKDAPPKAVPEVDAKALKDNVSNARPVTDQKYLDDGYVAEIPIGDHTYRRHKDGAWCRFSTPVCNLKVDPDIDKKIANLVEDAIPAPQVRPGKAPKKAAPEKAVGDAGGGKKKRGKKAESPEAKARREAKEQKAAQTERNKEILDSQIETMQGHLDQAVKENAELGARKVRPDSPEAKEIADEIALNNSQLEKGPKTLEDLRTKRADLEVTPLGKARAYSHSGKADAAVRTRAKGVDEVSGHVLKEPSVDHVVPIDEMVLMDGWDDLALSDQRAILSRLDNLKLMEKSLNSSKGARRWENWPAGKRHYPDKYDAMVTLERDLRGKIQEQIKLLAKKRTQ